MDSTEITDKVHHKWIVLKLLMQCTIIHKWIVLKLLIECTSNR